MCPLQNTAENQCPAMRATIKLRVLHAGLMFSTSLTEYFLHSITRGLPEALCEDFVKLDLNKNQYKWIHFEVSDFRILYASKF